MATGRLVGGNLSIVASLLGTPWALPIQGSILFLEDVSEALYRVDRLLTQLRHAGVLAGARGFLLGSFTEDADPAAVLREHLAGLGKPVLAGWPAGHGRPNRALPLGVRVTLDAGAGTLTLDEAVLA
jgi:muramoyltetrapeptide carboxypeptidase